ncbi:hypothetical protein [Devriesea agamarum]|uniref:hypothetical protein n=1 Tax=Devriesea agamarum TaxID=472569 RepID=UPI00071D9F16|nr:hypothetical protein [Devriesea agamarum]
MKGLRNTCAAGLLVLAFVLGTLSGPGVWLADHVVSRQGFLEIAGPVGDSPTVRGQIADNAVHELLNVTHLPSWIQSRIEPGLRSGARNVITDPSVGAVWMSTMGEVHDHLFVPGPIPIVLDLDPIAQSASDAVHNTVGVQINPPKDLRWHIASLPHWAPLEYAGLLTTWAPRAGFAAIGCAILAVLIGTRRRVLLVTAGLLTAASGGIVWWLGIHAGDIFDSVLPTSGLLGQLTDAFALSAEQGLGTWGLWCIGVGTLVVIGAIVAGGLTRRG